MTHSDPQDPTSTAAPGASPEPGASPDPGTSPPTAQATGEAARRLPRAGHAEVEIVAASPGVARKVAEALRLRFAAAEERSYPAGGENGGTRLVLTVDTIHLPPTEGSRNLWLVGDERSRTAAARPTARGRGKRPPTPTPSPDEPSGDGPTP